MRLRRPASFVVAAHLLGWIGPLVVANHLHGTTVTAIWTPDHVIIAVDGKLTQVQANPDGTKETQHRAGCKVIRRGSVAYVAAGFAVGEEFNIINVIDRSGDPSVPGEAIPKLRQNVKLSLERVLPYIRTHYPKRYAQFRSGHPILTLYIGWPNEPAPHLRVLVFSLGANGSEVVVTGAFKGARTDEEPAIFYDTVKNIAARLPGDWFAMDHVTVARDQVNAMIRADPAANGPPMAIVRIGTQAFEWIDKGKCSENAGNALSFEPSQP